MIETLISSKTRIKLLLKFFLNAKTTSYLRGLEQEFGDSSNSIRVELNRFEKAGMLSSYNQGNKKFFKANTDHPLYKEVHNIILKYIGVNDIIEKVVERLGKVNRVFLTGSFAKGIDGRIIDLIFEGDIDKNYLIQLIEKVEPIIKRKIRYIIYTKKEMEISSFKEEGNDILLLWSKE